MNRKVLTSGIRPTGGGCNIYHSHHYFTDPHVLSELAVACQNAEIGCVQCKAQLAAPMTDIVEPFREKRAKLTKDQVQKCCAPGSARLGNRHRKPSPRCVW